MNKFDQRKSHILKCLDNGICDNSPKGSVDELALPIITILNNHNDYYTTSSCSGRVSIYSEGSSSGWLLVSHDPIAQDALEKCLSLHFSKIDLNHSYDQLVSVKFEPFILHVEARSLEAGKMLLQEAIQAGFRNSGLVIGRENRFMVGIRSTLKLDVPVATNHGLLVNSQYINFLAFLVNEKFIHNNKLIDRLLQRLSAKFTVQISYCM